MMTREHIRPQHWYNAFAGCRFLLAVFLTGLSATAPNAEAADQLATTAADGGRAYGELAVRAERELRENILPFWLRRAPDPDAGGFYGEVSVDSVPSKNAARGSLLTSRILWAFAAANRRFPDAQYQQMARRAYDDLVNRFWDEENGGVYWTTRNDGTLLDATKQTYAQIYAIYGLSEYYRSTSEQAVLERAISLYRLVEKHARDPQHGGYFEAFSRDWQRLDTKGSTVNRVSSKSQNTHLHLMEAYTALLRVWPDAELRRRQTEMVEIMLTRIWDAETRHMGMFFDDAWVPQAKIFSYGHDIETAWLMTEAAEVIGDRSLIERTRKAAVTIAETTLAEGLDGEGAVYYEGSAEGLVRSHKEWWPQAEAAVGFMDAYQISGDARFLHAAQRSWAFIENHLVDRKNGEWFHSITDKGEVSRQPKISLWKCPYHNTRVCLELVERLGRLRAEKAKMP